jgi:hypothetical protein
MQSYLYSEACSTRTRGDGEGSARRAKRCPPTFGSRHVLRLRVAAPILLGAFFLVTGCGHPASHEECDELFAKSAEIELRGQNITDSKTIAERIAAAHTAQGHEFASQCMGKRITGRSLACARQATTAEQLEGCF